MKDEITFDEIEKFVWEASGYKADATQTDAVRVLIETRAFQISELGKKAPDLLAAQIGTLVSLAQQLLDTGGRMRLDPTGQLDAKDNPLATRKDVQALGRHVVSLTEKVQALADTPPAEPPLSTEQLMDLVAQRWTEMQERRALTTWQAEWDNPADAVYDEPSPWEEDKPAEPAEEEPVAAAPARKKKEKKPDVAPVLPEETREHVTRTLKPRRAVTADGKLACTTCGLEKPVADFFRNKKSPVGYESKCRSCRNPTVAAA